MGQGVAARMSQKPLNMPLGRIMQGAGIPKRVARVRSGDTPMRRYSAFAIAREALRHHTGWDRAWKSAAPKARYDVVIVGAGGHGLATAYWLGKNHGITNVAVIEKGWLGGGNTGRNTTIIRSN